MRAVITYKDIPRIKYATGGQSHPSPFRTTRSPGIRCHVGDRVAILAADTQEIADKALNWIKVDYEVLEPVLDMEAAMQDGASKYHDEPIPRAFMTSQHSRTTLKPKWATLTVLQPADHVFEGEYQTLNTAARPDGAARLHHLLGTRSTGLWCAPAPRCPSTCAASSPRSSPFVKRIRVIKPRIGGELAQSRKSR